MRIKEGNNLFALFLMVFFTLFAQASRAETIVTKWNDAALEAIRVTHPGPPIVARALAITCMFDAWTAYDKNIKDSFIISDKLTNLISVH